MTNQLIILFCLLFTIFVFLIWGKFRYDVVAFAALVIAVGVGVVPTDQAFAGFGHPAVVIVALVLIVSRGLSRSGAIELLAGKVLNVSRGASAHIAVMSSVSAVLSSLMNNVAALALLMPIDLKAAQRAERSPALTLMPLSFASILGGMVTLIGTPPNIVVATVRGDALGTPFTMFDFAPVGIVVAAVGVAYVVLIGWRLIPTERRALDVTRELAELGAYVAEAEVTKDSSLLGESLKALEELSEEQGVEVLGLMRRGRRLERTADLPLVRIGDVVLIEGKPDGIDNLLGAAGLTLDADPDDKEDKPRPLALVEAVVAQGARIEGRSADQLHLRNRQGVTLIGISRKGQRIRERVRSAPIQAGDVLLLLGQEERIGATVDWLGGLLLAERGLSVTRRELALTSALVFGAAILLASLGLVYLPVALAGVVVVYVALGIVPLSQIYESVEWSVLVLLGSMIPISVALEQSGGTDLLADQLIAGTAGWSPVVVLVVLMVVTMTLSDILNNVATALIAAPVAIAVAARLDANPDAFLMAVAIAASCAFLTPIGHKNNTIIMGPGGYAFGDYWRMGLPLEILVIVVSVPMILLVWPL